VPRRVKGLGETPSSKRSDFQWLLDDLCADLGVCLPADLRLRLLSEAERFTLDDFVDAVLQAEGLEMDDSLRMPIIARARRILPNSRSD
jgi:hypothetical protein